MQQLKQFEEEDGMGATPFLGGAGIVTLRAQGDLSDNTCRRNKGKFQSPRQPEALLDQVLPALPNDPRASRHKISNAKFDIFFSASN
jgi:hypothetical protein